MNFDPIPFGCMEHYEWAFDKLNGVLRATDKLQIRRSKLIEQQFFMECSINKQSLHLDPHPQKKQSRVHHPFGEFHLLLQWILPFTDQ
jgi:hypothetical protein